MPSATAGGHRALVADAPQAIGHRLGVRRLVVDDEHLNRRTSLAAVVRGQVPMIGGPAC